MLNILVINQIFDFRNYKNAFEAIFRIARDEGLFTLWRGALPTMGRAMVVNAAQLASYSQAKQLILQTGTCDITYLVYQYCLTVQ